jgi:hypothetical protein
MLSLRAGVVTLLFLAACGGAPKPASVAGAEGPNAPTPAVSVATDAPAPTSDASALPRGGSEVAVDRDGFLVPPHGILPEGYADRLLAAGAPPQVRLVSPGAEPRTVLRYVYKKGDKAHIGLTTDLAMSMAIDANAATEDPLPAPRKTPRITMGFATTIAAVDADGTALVNAVYEAAKASGGTPAANAAVEKSLAGIGGSTISYRVTASGRVSDVVLKLDPALQGPAREAMENTAASSSDLATPLPEVPIGVGATWFVDSRVASGGLDLFRRTKTTLDAVAGVGERTGPRITVRQQVATVAASPVANLAKLRQLTNASATLTEFSSRATGTTRQGLTRVADLLGKAHVDVENRMRVTTEETSLYFHTGIAMDVTTSEK